MARILMFLPPIIFAGLAATFLLGMYRENPDELPSELRGRTAPPVQVAPLGDGAAVTDAMLRAPGVKLVNYWASWCAPCRAEHPSLTRLAAEGVAVHGINFKDQPQNALGFLAELGNPYATLGADATGRMALTWGVYGVPETYVIDGAGKIVLRIAGPITERTLSEAVRPAIAAAK